MGLKIPISEYTDLVSQLSQQRTTQVLRQPQKRAIGKVLCDGEKQNWQKRRLHALKPYFRKL